MRGKNRKPPSINRISATKPQVAEVQNRGLVDRSHFSPHFRNLYKLDWVVCRLVLMNLARTLLFIFKWLHLTYKLSVTRNGRWPLVEGYEPVEYRDPKGRPFWELTASPDNSQFQKMLSDHKRKLTARTMIGRNSASASGAWALTFMPGF